MFSFSLVTPPAVEPITLSEAKTHMRVEMTADDALIATLIITARQWAEKYTNRAFVTQTFRLSVDQFSAAARLECDAPCEGTVAGMKARAFLRLPRPPLQSIASVQYYDENDEAVTWSADNYFVDTSGEPGRIALRSGCVWPEGARSANSLSVTYVAGYGATAAAVPDPIKMAIRQLVAHWYEHRGDTEQTSGVPQIVLALLQPYRVRYAGL